MIGMSRPCSAPSPSKHAPRCRSSRKGLEPGLPRAAHARPVSAPLPCVGRRDASRPGSAPFKATHQRPASAAAELGRRKQTNVGLSRVSLPLTFDEMYQVAKDRVAQKRLDLLLENQEMGCFSAWQLRGSPGLNVSRNEEEDPPMLKETCRSRDPNFKMSKEERQWVKSSLQMLGKRQRYACNIGAHTLTSSALGTSAAIHAPPSSEGGEELQGEREGERESDRGLSAAEKRTDLAVSEENFEGHRQQEKVAGVLPEKKTRRFVAVMQSGVSSGMLQDPAKVMFEYQRAREECEARRKKLQEKSEMRAVQSQELQELPEPSHQSYQSHRSELADDLAAEAHSREAWMRSKAELREAEEEFQDSVEGDEDTPLYQSEASVGTFLGSRRKSDASSGTFLGYSRKSVASSGSFLYQSENSERKVSHESEVGSLVRYKSAASSGNRSDATDYLSHQSEAGSLLHYKSAASSGNRSDAIDYPEAGSLVHHKSVASSGSPHYQSGAIDPTPFFPSQQSEAASLVRYKSGASSGPLYPSHQSEAKDIVESRRAREEWEARRKNLHVHFASRPTSPTSPTQGLMQLQEPLMRSEEHESVEGEEDTPESSLGDTPMYASEASVASFMRYSRKSVASEVGGLSRDPRKSLISSGSLLHQSEAADSAPLYPSHRSESRASVVPHEPALYSAYRSEFSDDTEGLQARFASIRTLSGVDEDLNEDLGASMKSMKRFIPQ